MQQAGITDQDVEDFFKMKAEEKERNLSSTKQLCEDRGWRENRVRDVLLT